MAAADDRRQVRVSYHAMRPHLVHLLPDPPAGGHGGGCEEAVLQLPNVHRLDNVEAWAGSNSPR